MGSFNKVVLMGNLTRDVELKQLPSGAAVADMGLAVNEKFRNKDSELVETTCFVDLVAWGRQAELCNTHLHKGSGVLVEGRLQYDKWETEDGQKRSRLRVRADRVQFVGRARNGNGDDGGATDETGMPF
jgi:single-strand DNA-binding protein